MRSDSGSLTTKFEPATPSIVEEGMDPIALESSSDEDSVQQNPESTELDRSIGAVTGTTISAELIAVIS